ncbi:unnamed protein product, partial [Sphacelaria rigidula]
LSYRPLFLGYDGADQIIADLIYTSSTLGMENHLLEFLLNPIQKKYEVLDISH